MELLEWDAKTYDALPLPHSRWGAGVVARLGATSGETILDLGCGTGRDVERVLDSVPDARIVGVDGSKQMLARARDRFAGRPGRVTLMWADLREPLHLDGPVDAAMSVAALHWVYDHDTVFDSVARALRPGGRFVAEWGGEGNIAGVRAAVERVGGDARPAAREFANVADTSRRLVEAGFVDVSVALVEDPAFLERGEQLEAFLATVILGADLRDMAAERRGPFVEAVAAALPEPVIDYVRLQVGARRPG
ncbi:MAG TPA: class I SAM-dependent methyltransferase [Acidimicrobiales bacterium]|nr:class I SAM-dependent methyltransferase [Acidimicrobiales bacterium]